MTPRRRSEGFEGEEATMNRNAPFGSDPSRRWVSLRAFATSEGQQLAVIVPLEDRRELP